MEYPTISRGSRGETDTPGPGESVSAIRFIGKFEFLVFEFVGFPWEI